MTSMKAPNALPGGPKGKGSTQSVPAVEPAQVNAEGIPVKPKSKRGSRACTVCRKLKMKCVVSTEEGGPCKRCKNGGHECIFEESQRGRRSGRKADQMAKSIKNMEQTLETMLKSLSPAILLSQAHKNTMSSSDIPLLSTLRQGISSGQNSSNWSSVLSGLLTDPSLLKPQHSPGPEANRSSKPRPGRLQSLPDNTLNPLGLLAEASLQSQQPNADELDELDEIDELESLSSDEEDTKPDVEGTNATSLSPEASIASGESRREHNSGPNLIRKRPHTWATATTPFRDRKKVRLGVANVGYFQPGPMNMLPVRKMALEKVPHPEILDGIITWAEALELFTIFFEHCHVQFPVLDPILHTPESVLDRSPFLFTAICAVASKYHSRRDIYKDALLAARKLAFRILENGLKSVEICQGFLLLCYWHQPSERFEEERVYQLSGIASRMGMDLNLHRKYSGAFPTDIAPSARAALQREILNRERTWLYTYICDRSVASQMGKPYSIPKDDSILRSVRTWYKQEMSSPTDSGGCAMVELHRIVTHMLDVLYVEGNSSAASTGLNASLDYFSLMKTFLAQLDQWRSDWEALILPASASTSVAGSAMASNPASAHFSPEDLGVQVPLGTGIISADTPHVARSSGDASAGTPAVGPARSTTSTAAEHSTAATSVASSVSDLNETTKGAKPANAAGKAKPAPAGSKANASKEPSADASKTASEKAPDTQKAEAPVQRPPTVIDPHDTMYFNTATSDDTVKDPTSPFYGQREATVLRSQLRDFYHSYYRLFTLSFGVQHALEHPEASLHLPNYCVLCFESASIMICIARDSLVPRKILMYSFDNLFVYLSYCAVFLLKFVSPVFGTLVEAEKALLLAEEVASILEQSAVDEAHTPAVYAMFLRKLIRNKRESLVAQENASESDGDAPSPRRPDTATRREEPSNESIMNFIMQNNSAFADVGSSNALSHLAMTNFDPASSVDADGPDGPDPSSIIMDNMLNNESSGFWDSMLMPGFGSGPFGGLSGGSGFLAGNAGASNNELFAAFGTPFHSRPATPFFSRSTTPSGANSPDKR